MEYGLRKLGKTLSGKVVLNSFDRTNTSEFTKDDHGYAARLHTKAMLRKRKNKLTREQHTFHSEQHEKHTLALIELENKTINHDSKSGLMSSTP